MLLTQFNEKYFKSLEGHKKILSPNHRTIYYTIIFRGIKVGIVGYFIPYFPKKSGFIQILIDPMYRGKGLAKQAINELIKKGWLEVLFSTIENSDVSSLKCFLKFGFKFISEKRMIELRKKSFLKENELRLIKFCWSDLN